MRGLVAPLALLIPVLVALPVGAEPLAVRYRIEARVDDGLETIAGDLEATIRNAGDTPIGALDLWLYPNLFNDEPLGVTDANRIWYSPFADGTGGIAIEGLSLDGRSVPGPLQPIADVPAGTGWVIELQPPLEPGEERTLRLAFRTRVPHRLGPFARAHGVLTALGGWHPWVTAPADDPLERRPAPADWRIDLEIPSGHVALVGGERLAERGQVELEAREWADLVVRPVRPPPLRTDAGPLWMLHEAPLVPERDGSLPNPPPFDSVWVGDELAELLERLDRWADARPEIPDPGPIPLVVVPLRSEIAIFTPGIVAISDRAYQVTPLRVIERFHARGIARAYLARRFLPLVRGCESPGIAWLLADALGARYAQFFTDEVLGTAEDAAGILGTFDFLPSVDDFLRARRSAFAHVYFDVVVDPIPVRDEPWTFSNRSPRGKLLLMRLEDWLGPERFRELLDRYLLRRECPLLRVAEAVAEEPLDRFFTRWTGPLPREDLRVELVESRPLPDGGWSSLIALSRIGDAPPEVIELAAWEEGGRRHDLVWRAQEGERSTRFSLETERRIERLRVDPRGRVAQTPADPNQVAQIGDEVPSRVQFLLTYLSVYYSAPDDSIHGDIDLLLRPRDAVHRRFGLGASHRAARLQVRTSITEGFGPRIDAARYLWNWSLGLSADYLRAGYGGASTREGFAVGPTFSLFFDDRPPSLAPMRGTAFFGSLSLGGGATRGEQEGHFYAGLGGGIVRLFPLGPHSALAARLKANVLFGEPPVQELLPLGGSDGALRAYPLESILVRQRFLASLEWRHPLLRDIDVDFGLFRLRRVSGALFVDGAWAGSIAPVSRARPDDAFFSDAGYGLRFDYDAFGVRPFLFAVDFAVPFNRASVEGIPPVLLSVRAAHSFAGF